MKISLFLITLIFLITGCTSQDTTQSVTQNTNYEPGTQTLVPSGFVTNATFTDFDGVTVDTLPAGHWNEGYDQTITPTGGSAPYTCEITSSAIPVDWYFTFNEASCELTGFIPLPSGGTTSAYYPFSFRISDVNGNVAGPFELTLPVTPSKPQLYSPYLSEAKIEENYSENLCGTESNTPLNCGKDPETFDPSGGIPPYTFSASGLPLGLTMRSDGLISGKIPTGAILGEYELTICVTDSTRTEACTNATLNVGEGCKPTHWTGKVIIPREQSLNSHCIPGLSGHDGLDDPDSARIEAEECASGFHYDLTIDFDLNLNMDLAEYYTDSEYIPYECQNGTGTFSSKTIPVITYSFCTDSDSPLLSDYTVSGAETSGTIYFVYGGLSTYDTYNYNQTNYLAAAPIAKVICYDEFGSYNEVTKSVNIAGQSGDECSVSENEIICPCYTGIGSEAQTGTCTFNRA